MAAVGVSWGVPGRYCRTGPSLNTRELLLEHGGFVYDSDAYNAETRAKRQTRRHARERASTLGLGGLEAC